MSSGTPWRIAGIACWLAIVLVSLMVCRRRAGYSWSRCTVVIGAGQCIALPMVALGFVGESALWTLANGGTAIEVPEALADMLTLDGLLWHVLEPALVSASSIALAAALAKSRTARVILSATGLVLALIALDVGFRIRIASLQALTPLWFSIAGDLLGGSVAGALLGYVSSRLIEARPRPLTVRDVSIWFTWAGGVLVAVLAIYLVFFRYLPDSVMLDVRGWKTVTFEYAEPRFGYGRSMPEVVTYFPLSAPTGWLTGPVGQADIDVNVGTPSMFGTARIAVQVWELTRSGESVRTPALLLSGARSRFNGQVPEGNIRIESDPFLLTILTEDAVAAPKWDGVLLGSALPSQPIRFSTDPRAMLILAFGGLGESIFGKLNVGATTSNVLTMSAGEDAHIRKGGIRQAIVVIGTPATLDWRIGGKSRPVDVRITLPDGNTVNTRNQPYKGENSGEGLQGVAVVIGVAGDPPAKVLVANTGRYSVCPSCVVQLKSVGGFEGAVRRVRVVGVEGRLQQGLKEYELKTRGEVFLGGGKLRVEWLDEKTVRFAGRTAPVTLDDVILSATVWGTLSNELQAVIVGAVISVLLGLALRRVGGARGAGPPGNTTPPGA